MSGVTARMPHGPDPLQEALSYYHGLRAVHRAMHTVLGDRAKAIAILSRAIEGEALDPDPFLTTSQKATPEQERHASHVWDPMCPYCIATQDPA